MGIPNREKFCFFYFQEYAWIKNVVGCPSPSFFFFLRKKKVKTFESARSILLLNLG